MNVFQLFLEVFIIVICGGACKKTYPVDRLFNPKGTILTLYFQGIVLIVVRWSFHGNIAIWVKVLWSIVLMVLLIGRIELWRFCGTHRGWSHMSDLLMNLQNLSSKVFKSVVINFSFNDCLDNICRSNDQEYNQNILNSLNGQTCLRLLHETHSAILWILIKFT